MSKWLGLSLLGCLLAALLLQGSSTAQPPGGAALSVSNQVRLVDESGRKAGLVALVTLYKQGQAVRSTDLSNVGSARVDWKGLAPGSYEVHFEAKGYGKVVKRVVLAPGVLSSVVLGSIGQNDEAWGAGPTLFELQRRITALETENQNMKVRVVELEKKR
jgi:hypothetical protein